MKSKSMNPSQTDVVSIRDASHMLGVNEVTLRQWTDEGKLKAFVTPGGHRRYSVSDLKKFTRSSQKMLGIKDLAVEMEDTTMMHGEIARTFLEKYMVYPRPDVPQQRHLAELGRNLLMLMVRYVSEPAKREEILMAAQSTGAGFGRDLAELGWPLTDCVEAFISHRNPFIKAAVHMISKREPVKGSIMEAIPLANFFIDKALVSMITAHQQYLLQKGGGTRL
jgi:excisionase family DNA binding protein